MRDVAGGGAPPEQPKTFVFTDIVGSTPLVHALGHRYARLLEEHNAIMRAAWSAHGGTEVGTEGDSFFVTFTDAGSAVRACVAAQRALLEHDWPDRIALHVRAGMHTGEASRFEGDHLGIDVNIASRIASGAHGDQILVSGATLAAAGALDPGVGSIDLGMHGLKGVPHAVSIHQVVAPGLPTVFPPPVTLRAVRNNLPQPPGVLRGRTQERARAHELLLGPVRVVTIVGTGGNGKTRLALEIAHDLLAYHPCGVFLVEGAPLDAGYDLPRAIAAAMGIDLDPDTPVIEQITGAITSPALFVLDNLEHLDGAPEQIAALIAASAHVRVLATSRNRLRIRAENVLTLDPLEVPGAAPATLAALEASPAAQLFMDRARASDLGRGWSDSDAPGVARIVRGLDGVPLALELAGARVGELGLERIEAGLSRAAELLTEGDFDLPPRQRSMTSAIRWSVDLLDDDARHTLTVASVFRGGAARDALEAVSGRPLDADLRALSAAHLLTLEGDRVVLLEPVRAAAEDLASGIEALEAAHLAWFEDLAERSWDQLAGHHQREWLARMIPDTANLDRALRAAPPDKALSMAANLGRFWARSGRASEGLERLGAALAGGTEGTSAWVRAMLAIGNLARRLGRTENARDALTRAAEGATKVGDVRTELQARIQLGEIDRLEGETARAAASLTSAAERAQAEGAPDLAAHAMTSLALAIAHTDRARAIGLLQEAEGSFARAGDHHNEAQTAMNRATLLGDDGRADEAAAVLRPMLEHRDRLGDEHLFAHVLVSAGWIDHLNGDASGAESRTREAIDILRDLGDTAALTRALANLSTFANDRGERARALELAEQALEARARTPGVLPVLALSAGFMALQEDEPARALQLLLREPWDLRSGEHASSTTVALAIAQARLSNREGALASITAARTRPGAGHVDGMLMEMARELLGAGEVEAAWNYSWNPDSSSV